MSPHCCALYSSRRAAYREPSLHILTDNTTFGEDHIQVIAKNYIFLSVVGLVKKIMVSSEGTEDFWTNSNDRHIMKMVKLPNNNCKYLFTVGI